MAAQSIETPETRYPMLQFLISPISIKGKKRFDFFYALFYTFYLLDKPTEDEPASRELCEVLR